MRKIKFRGWDLNNKKMYDSYIVDENGNFCVNGDFTNNCECSEEDRVIQMQFTGLKDKNGKEIYEGDVVVRIWRLSYWEHPTKEVFVVGSDDCPFNDCSWINKFEENDYKISDTSVEVIGNIYENPKDAKGSETE